MAELPAQRLTANEMQAHSFTSTESTGECSGAKRTGGEGYLNYFCFGRAESDKRLKSFITFALGVRW